MAIPQAKLREIIFQMLYSRNMGHASPEDLIKMLSKELCVSKSATKTAMQTVDSILTHQDEIDQIISDTSHAYDFDRIHSVERNILRLSTYELVFRKDIPSKVSISEGIRLARKFGTAESASFINALLDAIYKSVEEKISPFTARDATLNNDTD